MNKTKFFSSLLVAVLFASTSVFTSCKDYDDDIKNLQTQIDAKALKTDLESLKTSLEGQITTLQSTLDTKVAALQTAIDKKADQTTVDALASTVADLTARVVVLETKVATIENALATYATKEELAAVKAALDGKDAELEKAIGDEAAARETAIDAVNKSIEQQKQALEAYKKEVEEKLKNLGIPEETIQKIAKLDERLTNIEEALKNFATTSDLDALKSKVQELASLIDVNNANLNALELFVHKRLTSLVLKPDFYWEGLAGIEVPYAVEPVFTIGKPREFTYKVKNEQTAGYDEVDVFVEHSMEFGGVCVETGASDTKPVGYWIVSASSLDNSWQRSIATTPYLNDLTYFSKGDSVEISKGAVASYHINPTTADLEGMTIKFYENDAEVYTRSIKDSIGATPLSPVFANSDDNANVLEDGILSIPFYLKNYEDMYTMFKNWAVEGQTYSPMGFANGSGYQLPFIAAQLAKGDTIVTSDYAVVVPAMIKIAALADNNALETVNGEPTDFYSDLDDDAAHYVRGNHLYESAGYNEQIDTLTNGAIPMPATHVVQYDSIFVFDFIETHYNYLSYTRYGTEYMNNINLYEPFETDQVMSDALMLALGLHYEYTLVNYTVGDNTTGESVHMEQVDANGNPTTDKTSPYFAPRSVDEQGKMISGKVATREAIDREPLVRVDLVNEDGKIIRYGYVKIRIVEEDAKGMEVTIDLGEKYFNCGDSARVTWSQMENLILAKIGEKGMSKKEFEANYYLDVVGGYTNMPYINPSYAGSSDPACVLYSDDAVSNGWMAKRFYKNEDGEYVAAADSDDDDDMASLDDYTAYNNWFGRVWYTPHDNATSSHNWDEATNVLVWNIYEENAGNMNEDAYVKLMEVTGATYLTKGKSVEEFSTVVRFVNKNNGTSIYVTLKFAPGNLNFAAGDINRRVLDHWFDFKEGYKDDTPDTIEVYANVQTPALRGESVPHTTESFKKDLTEYWLKQDVIPTIYNADKFDEFEDALSAEFRFRIPVKGASTDEFDEPSGFYANSSNVSYVHATMKYNPDGASSVSKKETYYWTVKGISGQTYTLYLATQDESSLNTTAGELSDSIGNQIIATVGAKNVQDQIIATITEDGIIQYIGYGEVGTLGNGTGVEQTETGATVNNYATDILNYTGMYDATGKLQKDTYLDGQANTFTAYVDIKINSENCYDPLIGKSSFNVRFLRPVNMWPAETNWKDAPNATQIYPIWKLVYIRDWRQYAVVPAGLTQKFGPAAVAGTGLDGKDHKGDFTEGNVTYEFYGIENLYVDRDEIRSDAHKAPADRVILTDPSKIESDDYTLSITDIPALTGTNTTSGTWQYLKIWKATDSSLSESEIAAEAGSAQKGNTGPSSDGAESDTFTNYLAYTNNGGVVKPFHVYVPISLKYPWGSVADWTQKVWAVITIDPTQGNE